MVKRRCQIAIAIALLEVQRRPFCGRIGKRSRAKAGGQAQFSRQTQSSR